MRKIYTTLQYVAAVLLFPIYLPHILVTGLGGGKLRNDVLAYKKHFDTKVPTWLFFLWLIHTDRYFRNIFYYRIGPVASALIGWYRPGDRYFLIPKFIEIGGGFVAHHPYSTVLNAKKIGENFVCCHLTTLGYGKDKGLPTIGDNVAIGCGATIIGNVKIGNNVKIGAGSVVVKDIPDNAVAVGNPCKVVKIQS